MRSTLLRLNFYTEGPKKELIINRQLCHFIQTDPKLGMEIPAGLGVNDEEVVDSLKNETVES